MMNIFIMYHKHMIINKRSVLLRKAVRNPSKIVNIFRVLEINPTLITLRQTFI